MFEMTREGCEKAKAYLIAIGRFQDIEHEQSTDGYTIVALANSLYEKYNPETV